MKLSKAWIGTTIFWMIAMIPVIVVLIPNNLVLQDGGLHIDSSTALRGLINGWFPNLLEWQSLSPNTTVEALLALLTSYLSADVSLRLVAVLGLFGFAWGVVALMRAIGRPVVVGVVLLPFQMSSIFMLGFVGFVWATDVMLFAIAVVLANPTRPPRLLLATLLTITWLTHLGPAGIGMASILSIMVVARISDGSSILQSLKYSFRYLIAPFAIPVALTLYWLFSTRGQESASTSFGPLWTMRILLSAAGAIVYYSSIEVVVSLLVAMALVAAAVMVIRRRAHRPVAISKYDGLLVSAAVWALIAIVAPSKTTLGSGFTNERLTLFAWVFAGLWLCAESPQLTGVGHKVWISSLTITAAMAAILPISRIPPMLTVSDQLTEINTLAACLPERSRFLQLNLSVGEDLSARGMQPMAEQTGTLSRDRESLQMGNEAGWYPFYLWGFKEGLVRANEFVPAGSSIDAVPPTFDISRALDAGLPLDAIVLYGRSRATAETLSSPETRATLAELSSRFNLVRVSPSGAAELWMRKGLAPSCR
ncbi:hypothetical protein [Gordonia rhizosphera]|uniref:Glycosyltransferase RgtA/B/C/D-like domain-containing protein n=1 Tax=Gordonia rhizosphera NBRC 16068 TaxID=1108045 RepID=K6WXS2_9ACTN|nr:hypothetical protein [Gordonia rhizosphera]GAB91324.1 hypothetical protein GORHZ_127_00050 [Gordonia rhizosphera NBRC 16068]